MSKTILTKAEAKALLKPGKTVHVFSNPAPAMIIGCDWDRDEIEALIDKSATELAGPQASGMGHGLCITGDRRL